MRVLALFLILILPLTAVETATPLQQLNITELTLKNGLKVCLKVMPESEEIQLQLFALGGAAAFPESDLAAVLLAPDIALESGLGDFTHEAIAKEMSEYGTDFSVQIQPYQRIIEGSCYPDGLPSLLKWISLTFTAPRFTEIGLSKVLEQTRDSIQNRQQDCDALFDQFYQTINTQHTNIPEFPTLKELDQIKLPVAQAHFNRCFSDPSQFMCVIVGEFDLEKMKEQLKQTLETIPASPKQQPLVDRDLGNNFPPGITTKVFRCGHDDESLTRITFPLTLHDEEQILDQLEFVCQVIETRLRDSIRAQRGTTHAIDVGYEFPLYPHLSSKWLTLQFRSTADEVKLLVKLTRAELEKLRREGPLESEIKAVDLLLQRTDEFWATENSYWVAMISNYLKWGWSLDHLHRSRAAMSKELVQQFLQDSFAINNFSVIIRSRNEK
jgi:zinc protease